MERGMGYTKGPTKQGWEYSDFPILCEICLGDNPYVRMMKAPTDKECKICTRPFTVFRWRAGTKGRFKKTEVCQTCAKLKNVCQTCLFDLEYGMPVEIRDKEKDRVELPTTMQNRDYFINQANQHIDNLELSYEKANNPILEQFARLDPYFQKRNKSHICSFFLKGTCKRVDCPYRHEVPISEEGLAKQTFSNRFHGKDDVLAGKIITKILPKNEVIKPKDIDISTLVIPIIPNEITEEDIRNYFMKYGIIDKISQKEKSVEITFEKRNSAEKAMEENKGHFYLNGKLLKIHWQKWRDKDKEFPEIDDDLFVPGYMKDKPIEKNEKEDFEKKEKKEKKENEQLLKMFANQSKVSYPSMNPFALGGPKKNKGKK